jgi:hypothetical protein
MADILNLHRREQLLWTASTNCATPTNKKMEDDIKKNNTMEDNLQKTRKTNSKKDNPTRRNTMKQKKGWIGVTDLFFLLES